MKITEIHVDNFGHWKDLELPELSAELTVIHGPNEAGKSTLLHLIRAILYGFSAEHHARFVPPRYAGPVGGRLEVKGPSGRFHVRRRLPDNHDLRTDQAGELVVRAVDGSLQGKHLLGSLLNAVDDAIFRNVFAIGLSEMQQLATLSDTAAAQQLYGLAAGADRVAVADVSRRLEAMRQRHWDGNRDGSIPALIRQRRQLAENLERERALTQQWVQLRQTRRQVDDEIAHLEKRRKGLGESVANEDGREQIRTQWKTCRQLHAKIKSLGPVPEISADAVDQLDRLAKQLGQRRKAWERLRDRRRQLRQQARELASHAALLQHAEAIQTLHHRARSIGELAGKLEQSKAQLEETEFELQAELERLGLKSNWRTESLPLITDEMIDQVRAPSHDAREARHEREAAEQAESHGLQAAERAARQLAERLKLNEPMELTELLAREQERITLLQQRLDRQGELNTANRQQKEAREDYREWAQRQLLPWRGLMALGMIFSVGVIVLCVALFAGFFRVEASQRTALGFIGLVICGLALSTKETLEFVAGRSAARCRAAIAGARKKLDRIVTDIRQLESKLPAGQESVPFAVQLEAAEERWQTFSELQPLDQLRLEALQQVERARAEKARAEQRYEQARQNWRDRLRQHGLPQAMTPSQFRQLVQPDSQIGKLRQRLLEFHQKVDALRREVQDVHDRLRMIFERIGQVPDGDQLHEQIEQLHRLLQEARQTHQQRESLHRKWREQGREQNQIARTALRLQAKRQELVARHGVADTRELKRVVRRRQQATKWRRERDELLAEIAGRLGNGCTLSQLRKALDAGDFDKRLAKWEREHEETSGRLAELLERRGELGQQIKELSAPPLAFNKRLQLQEIEAQLDEQALRWQTLAGIAATLNQVRESYESDRQPETLAEASGYLKQLTQARYPRIWTPFGESSLCVDDRQGKAIRVEHLSRGTREQVYLSLRLALAAAYGRRGASLPLILDDVFVNFDAQRVRCAVETIVRFAAAGHQVLVFTCHDHIRDLFATIGGDLRQLPDAEQHAQSPEPVLPGAVVSQPPSKSAPPESPLPPAPTLAPSPSPPSGLSTEGDAELDYELLYGAPEYEPGYEPTPPAQAKRKARGGRRVRIRTGRIPAPDRPPRRFELPPDRADACAWGQVAEYVEWIPPRK